MVITILEVIENVDHPELLIPIDSVIVIKSKLVHFPHRFCPLTTTVPKNFKQLTENAPWQLEMDFVVTQNVLVL